MRLGELRAWAAAHPIGTRMRHRHEGLVEIAAAPEMACGLDPVVDVRRPGAVNTFRVRVAWLKEEPRDAAKENPCPECSSDCSSVRSCSFCCG